MSNEFDNLNTLIDFIDRRNPKPQPQHQPSGLAFGPEAPPVGSYDFVNGRYIPDQPLLNAPTISMEQIKREQKVNRITKALNQKKREREFHDSIPQEQKEAIERAKKRQQWYAEDVEKAKKSRFGMMLEGRYVPGRHVREYKKRQETVNQFINAFRQEAYRKRKHKDFLASQKYEAEQQKRKEQEAWKAKRLETKRKVAIKQAYQKDTDFRKLLEKAQKDRMVVKQYRKKMAKQEVKKAYEKDKDFRKLLENAEKSKSIVRKYKDKEAEKINRLLSFISIQNPILQTKDPRVKEVGSYEVVNRKYTKDKPIKGAPTISLEQIMKEQKKNLKRKRLANIAREKAFQKGRDPEEIKETLKALKETEEHSKMLEKHYQSEIGKWGLNYAKEKTMKIQKRNQKFVRKLAQKREDNFIKLQKLYKQKYDARKKKQKINYKKIQKEIDRLEKKSWELWHWNRSTPPTAPLY